MVNVRLRRFVQCLVCTTTLVTSAPWVTLSAQNDTVGVHGVVTTVTAGGLIRKPANFFDLEGTTVTFTPNDAGEYAVAVGDLDWRDPGPGTATRFDHWSGHLAVDLPFPFPFAGRTWTRVYANVNGNISFQRPERMNWPHRDPWADASMRSIAAAIDSRSAAELEAMIAVVWAFYGDTTISVDSTPDRVVITWRAFRRTAVNAFYEALGENLFQARLYPSGVIELAYRAVPERDGIVGLFHGLNAGGHILHAVDDAVGDVAHAVLDITKAELVDNGSTLLARMTFAEDVPEQVVRSAIDYQVIIRFGDTRCAAGIEIDADGRRPFADWCGPQPSVVGYRVRGRTIEIPISKTLLNGADHFSWQAGAVWWDEDFDDTQRHTVHVGEPDYNLRALSGAITGNVFEVFHYPTVPKHRLDRVLSYIYQRAPANDEIAVTFTAFRMDDLFNSGGGTGPVNAPVQGIGERPANPTRGEHYASDKLLTSMMPVFIGAPNFNETGVSNGRQYRAFSPGIRWIAHEAVHRWAAHISFRHPRTGRIEDLLDDYCRCHWSNYLHAPAAYPVWPSYSSEPYSEASVMGGAVWLDNGDGSFTRVDNSYPLATGLSALDLYVMGMIPPSEVPDTFLLRDVQETDRWDTVRATKVPVRIEDIVAAMGPRVPAADVSQKEFRLGVYLLHEDGRPPRADLLERAQALTAAIPEYFAAATGGRMRVVPTVTPPMTGPVAPVPVVPVGTESFSIPDRGGTSTTSSGKAETLRVGYGRIRAEAGSTTPSGIAIFQFRNSEGVLISEAGVPAAGPVQEGRIFAEVNGPVNTGLAIANPNDMSATIRFYFTDTSGTRFADGSFELGAHQQTAKFLDQAPFNGGPSVLGTLTFTASVPVAVVAIRGFTNDAGEFLMTTMPVAPPSPLSTTPTGTVYFPHFADGNGWATQVILVNPTDRMITGTVGFLGPGSDTATASPAILTLDDGRTGSDFDYSIAPRSAQRFTTSNPPGGLAVGSVRATPEGGNAAPSGLVVFSFALGGKTLSEASVQALPKGSAFRVYVEASGMPGQAGSIRSGLAVTNAGDTANTVTLEVTHLDGSLAVPPATLMLPPSGQTARFLDDIFTLPDNFAGVLRVTSTGEVAVVGLRLRINENGELKMTTTPPSSETGPLTTADLFFPHLADSEGWSTQFVLFSGTAGQTASGTLGFIDASGQPLDLTNSQH